MRNFVIAAAMAAMVCGCSWEGEQGESGVVGEAGIDGDDGQDGENGAPGQDGENGEDGAPGSEGPQGEPGSEGPQGEPGEPGQPGAPGRDGADGQDGADGEGGCTVRRNADDTGSIITCGDTETEVMDGEDGTDGRDGADGEDGRDGEDGQDGAPGELGRDGRDGADGRNGEDGEDGQNGRDSQDGQPAEGEGEGEEPECDAGTADCRCYGNGTCNDGLSCDLGVCVLMCTQRGCQCELDNEDGCDDGLLCSQPFWGGGTFCDGDFDEDGVADMADNCPRNANESQADLDGDHEGDVCDGDTDGDEVPNRADHCSRFWDRQNACPCQPDTAGDPGDAAEVAACYSGLNATRGVGLCRAGTRRCEFNENTLAITWSSCAGEVLPAAEICGNGLDENCNGAFDDGCAPPPPPPECNPAQVRVCGNPAVGQCRQGQQTCGADSRWGVCIGEVRSVAEVCGNGLDEDCDAVADDGCPAGGGPGPDGGTDVARMCVPGDPAGTWTVTLWNDPQGVGAYEVTAGNCREVTVLTANRLALRFNARRPNAGLYCAGWVNNPNDLRNACPGFTMYLDGIQQVLEVVNEGGAVNYRIRP